MTFQLLSRSAAAAAAPYAAAAGSSATAAAAAAHPSSLCLVGLVRRVQREALHARVELRSSWAVRSCKFPHTGGAPTVRERESESECVTVKRWPGKKRHTGVEKVITGGGRRAARENRGQDVIGSADKSYCKPNLCI